MSRPLRLSLLLGVLLVVPGLAQGHGNSDDGHVAPVPTSSEPDLAPPTSGYTGPGAVPYLSFFEGVWMYGQSSATPLAKQVPREIVGSGDWLAWEDTATGRIYVYNVPAGAGYYVGNASAFQRNPAISGTLLTWEEYRPRQAAQIVSYDLTNGNLRTISSGPGSHKHPSIDGTLVAWEDDRNGTTDIWGYDFANDTQFPIFSSPDKEQDPLVRGHVVYFRAYRYNVWDLEAVDLDDNATLNEITADSKIQTAPFTNGPDVYFLNQYIGLTWTLAKYDARVGRVSETTIHLQDSSPTPLSGDRMIEVVPDVGYSQLVARNITSATTSHITGDLALIGTPYLDGKMVYMALRTKNGTSLVALDVSSFAFGKPATLTINSPGSVYPWVRPVVIQGALNTGGGWTEPVTFSYRIDDGAPVAIPPAQAWRVTLDNADRTPGNHRITLRATFREGPPVGAALTLVVPTAASNVDVAAAGQDFHAARVLSAFNEFVVRNPASYLLIVLVIALVILVLVRLWLFVRRARATYLIEYVPPEE